MPSKRYPNTPDEIRAEIKRLAIEIVCYTRRTAVQKIARLEAQIAELHARLKR